jgi:peroxiredoxin
MTLRTGDPTPDLTFLRPEGSAVALSAFRGRPLLLIFLRHLA